MQLYVLTAETQSFQLDPILHPQHYQHLASSSVFRTPGPVSSDLFNVLPESFFMSANLRFKPSFGVRSLLVLLIATLISLPAFAQNQPLFPVTPLFDIGDQQVLASGDFNGDGQPDLITILPNNQNSTLITLLNQGNTNPPLTVTAALNFAPFSLIAVDINNDKKLDLVASVGAGVAVLIGNGDGTFQMPAMYPIVGPGKITAVDLNGDGYLDLVYNTATNATNPIFHIAVLLNQGISAPGVLSPNPVSYPLSITYSLLDPVLNIGSGDFNGDGKQDIFVGGTNTAVFYGNGDGTLQAQQSPPVPTGLSGGAYFVATDLNHDGISDIAYLATATSNTTQLSLQVMLGHSNGVFTVGSNLALDFAGIDQLGLVTAGTTGGNVNLAFINQTTTILRGDGNGNFSQGLSYPLIGAAFPIPGHNGNTDLAIQLFGTNIDAGLIHNQITRLVSNGDGTFQGIPTLHVGPSGFAVADLNNDGLTDVLTVDTQNNLVTALGRGNGTFTVTNHTTGAAAKVVVTADFNADGNQDAAIITPGDGSLYPTKPVVDSTLIFYKGNGDGTFQPSASPVDLQVIGAIGAITGDFNDDGNIDIVVSYYNRYNDPTSNYGIVFLPGKGDGTFGTPAPIQANNLPLIEPLILAADVNNDHKLDILWSGLVYLGNGDGTFQLSTVSLPAPALAVGDLNGDGIPDAVTGSFNVGANVYAGNGDGTFQNSSFYTAAVPAFAQPSLATITDSNADGHPDLLLQYNVLIDSQYSTTTLAPFLGDGKGNFTADSNIYYAGNPSGTVVSGQGLSEVTANAVLARLNNLVPQQSKNTALDYLTWTSGGATALLNQTNPAPTAPSLFPSKTALAVSANNAAPTQQLTFTATVTGVIPPTGNVSFTSGSTTLGTASLTKGVATLPISFPATGTYAVTASYAGDANNQTSSSNPVSVAVAPVTSKTTLTVSTSSANQNQQLTFTASVTGSNPTGNVTFVSGSTTLGTASLTNGTASLPFAFTTAGSFTVTANYAGDAANLASVSNTVTVAVVGPDFTVSASPATATIAPGQPATTTLSIAPLGGYNGTVTFSCGTLPAGAACTFAPASVTPASGATATTTLTITTTAPTTALLRKLTLPLHGIAWASFVLLVFSPQRLRKLNYRLKRADLLTVFPLVGLLSLAGCSSSPKNPTTTNPGTPAGLQTVTVTAADSAGKLSHTATFQVTVQ
jgi:Bacterial Ig-like domain (group 3)/FG-GAP-like repeat